MQYVLGNFATVAGAVDTHRNEESVVSDENPDRRPICHATPIAVGCDR